MSHNIMRYMWATSTFWIAHETNLGATDDRPDMGDDILEFAFDGGTAPRSGSRKLLVPPINQASHR
jgi:hypothetical protein